MRNARASELRGLAELVADTLVDWHALGSERTEHYRPTILDGAMAAAFDHAMARARCPVRCWRGSRAEA